MMKHVYVPGVPVMETIRSIQLPSRWLAAQASVQHDGRQVLKQCELVPQECSPNLPIIKEPKMDNWKPKEFQRKPQLQMIVNGQCSIFRLDCQSFRWDNARNTPALLPTSQLWWCLKGRDPGTASQTHRWPQVDLIGVMAQGLDWEVFRFIFGALRATNGRRNKLYQSATTRAATKLSETNSRNDIENLSVFAIFCC